LAEIHRVNRGMSTEIEIAKAGAEDATLLARLYQLYLYDFGQYLELPIDDAGCFDDGVCIDDYLRGGQSDAWLLRLDGKPAGFALLDHEPDCTEITEFFVLARHRRRGLGRRFFGLLASRFPGRWEAAIVARNAPAKAFWRSVVHEIDADYQESEVDDDGPELRVRWRC
jgi:predicted acetyltransferase